MRITELLTKDTIQLHVSSHSKNGVIDELVSVLDQSGKLQDRDEFKKAILNREAQSTTGIGEGIAIPHAKTSAVKAPAIAFGKSEEGVDYESLDGAPAHLFFMIAATEGANQTHLEALSRLSSMLMDMDVRKALLNASTKEEVLEIINAHDGEDEEETTVEETAPGGKVLAVTACPTGIAHTYMAADALKAKAKTMDLNLKVETNGSGGAKNVLTQADIESAIAIIVAADTKVEMNRFKGKHVIEVPVAEAIRRPEELLNQAMKQDAPVYKGGEQQKDSDKGSEKKQKSGFYKHLMNGVSNMLPFVVGGGILIAISFLFGIQSANPDSPEYNEFAAILNTIGGGNAFYLMVPVLAGFIAMSIADRPGFAPGMVGGLIAATGQSGFLGGIIAGFLAGYVVLGIKRLTKNFPSALEGIKPVLIYPLLGIFVTGVIMLQFLVEPLSAVNTGIQNWLDGLGTGNLILLGLILGGMMAVDMGGPINKAAFTFGIAMIEGGNLAPHAAIMAGGMVPPLGLAMATTLFKKKFNDNERKAGIAAYFMGASFITEGAIPFAAADPFRVIPSIVTGSAIAGALTMFFGIGLPAPHGGLFVFPVVEGNPFLYLLAVLIGSVITALMVGFLKKPVK
ncbi:PTS system D-fructose-specific IIA component (F1P-forming) (Frc family) /PTS system D-fructose-specific IIB component (F1P-forming) (Frc family) /PTS system D-fructose-specific IIC component (F1P-forming) (Frc family) [Bacillus sp. V-88]|nr:PTS fructose transporter subunit IIA [Bacillus sp. DSM 27956]PRX74415.1 PTS system D-fructose-specific IIA component (F1P-forming) (Frc family) /PTS system D-fructose-specific IIB component (F1P-forming) (Frc family) /PTS system D-fructose-specific IIC component (F1P-forming) (Frc family) [Bacillus sp. V-88]SLK23871.1 PTS system D-fructose-specific IIA component (F1P-forming), Frc family /PTS system D-fructose-specific IIB component (F1P-forming), Frc family /PTS system D-fructose-specific IIC